MYTRSLTRRFVTILLIVMIVLSIPATKASMCPNDATGAHDFGEWTVSKNANCSRTGREYRVCRNCGEKETRSIAKKDHTYGNWITVKAATCAEEGERTRQCRVCGHTETIRVAKADHTWGRWIVVLEPTDWTAGEHERTCTVCGRKSREAFYPDGTLKNGDRGDAVRGLQESLNAKGFDCGSADGIYGKKTAAAVSAFEAELGRDQDGIAWPGLIKALLGSDGQVTSSKRDLQHKNEFTVTVTIYPFDGSFMSEETVEVQVGMPTDLSLRYTSKNGERLVWYRDTRYGKERYLSGMCFYEDTALYPRLEDDSYCVRFWFDEEPVCEYRVDNGQKFTILRDYCPIITVGDYYVEWYTERDGKGTAAWDCTIDDETEFYGVVRGYITELTLQTDEVVYSHIFGHKKFDLEKGTTVQVIQTSNMKGVDWLCIVYNDNGLIKTGYLKEPRVEKTYGPKYSYLDANGGTVEPNVIESTDPKDFPTPERECYNFTGWKLLTGNPNTNRVYQAEWDAINKYELTIDLQFHVAFGKPQTVVVDAYSTDYTLPTPKVLGCEFTGWLDQNGKTFTPGQPITEDTWVTAQYNHVGSCTITFDMTVWDAQPSKMVNMYSTDYTLPVPEEKDGYEFTGWRVISSQSNDPNARANKNVRAFTPGEPITANLTLQAQYRQTKGYTITFDAGEGNHIGNSSAQTLAMMTTPEGKMASYPPAVSPNSKTYFEGWYTSDGKRVDNDESYVFKKDTTLYAQWSKSATVTIK